MAAEFQRLSGWLRTREGGASSVVALVLFCVLAGPADERLEFSALMAAFAVVAVALVARLWEARTAPRPPEFSRILGKADGSIEVQRDENAGFWRDRRGFLWSRRVWFAGTACPPRRLRPEVYLRLRVWHDRNDLPVFVARSRERQWWWWRDAFYWESGDYEPEGVRPLLVMLEREDEQGVELELDIHLADPIPGSVKRAVYERDGGRCQACGSDELIQYDHIVGSSMGGTNELDNLQLLCAACNRRKALIAAGHPDRPHIIAASAADPN